jgi:PrtD family type I secretion system ABC transporter
MNQMQPRAALREVVSGAKRSLLLVAGFSVIINLLMLTVPIYMMQMYDRVLPTRHLDTLLLLSAMAVGALALMSAIEVIRSRIMVRFGTWMDRTLGGPLLDASINDTLRSSGAQTRGAVPLRDLTTVRQFLTGPGVFPLVDAPWVPIFVALIFLLHSTLGWIAVGGAIIVFLFAIANDVATRPTLGKANSQSSRSLYRADAAVRNAEVIAALGMAPALTKRWQEAGEASTTFQAKASDISGVISSAARFVRLMLQIAMLGAGAYLVIQDQLTGGAMIGASIILGRAMAPIEQSIASWRGLIAARNAFKSICRVIERQTDQNDATSLPVPEGRLQVEGVTFIPPGEREPIIRQVSFAMMPGEQMGLIGPSASGKTTLARLLVGSWSPTAGAVRLDSADLAYWAPEDRGPHIGYMPQDVELFDGTVRENIARLTDADSEAVVEAAQLARVHEMILRLPDGYDTQIGEGGVRLSGGQRQRIALARSVFGRPKFLVLDEPNANLDRDGDIALLETLRDLKELAVTVIVITHRPSILAHVDTVTVLNQGRIEMTGPREEVMKKLVPEGQRQIGGPDANAPSTAPNGHAAPAGPAGSVAPRSNGQVPGASAGAPAAAAPAPRPNGGVVNIPSLSPGSDSPIVIRPGRRPADQQFPPDQAEKQVRGDA